MDDRKIITTFFEDNGQRQLANFNHDQVNMLELDEVVVYPTPIERQRMSTSLKVFSEKTIVALVDYAKVKGVDVSGTILFLSKFIERFDLMKEILI